MKFLLIVLMLIPTYAFSAESFDSYLIVESDVLYKGRIYESAVTSLGVANRSILLVAANGDRATRPLRKVKDDGSLYASSKRIDVGLVCQPDIIKESSGGKVWTKTAINYAVLCEPKNALVVTYELDSRDDPTHTVLLCSWLFPHKFEEGKKVTLLALHNYGGWSVVDKGTGFSGALGFCNP